MAEKEKDFDVKAARKLELTTRQINSIRPDNLTTEQLPQAFQATFRMVGAQKRRESIAQQAHIRSLAVLLGIADTLTSTEKLLKEFVNRLKGDAMARGRAAKKKN